MADPLDIFRQRERPGYFVQPATPPRDITSLSDAELDSYLRGFSSPPIGNDPTASPYSARDLRLERARRQPATRRNEGFELEDGRNELPLPPVPPPIATATSAARPTNTNAPARTPTVPRQPATDPALLRAAATDPNFSDQGSLYGPPRPPNLPQQQPTQSSVLDMLRKRMARDIEGEALQRASEFGAGMLASGSPNFFAMLGGGARAAREGDVSRMDQLRRLADLERQDAAQRAEEARRQEELRIREAAQAAEAPLRAAQTRYYLSRAEADPTDVAFTRAENAARGAASAAANQAVQAENNRRSRAIPPLPPLTAAETATLRNTVFQQSLIERGFTPPAGAAAPATTAAPAAPAARIDALGRPIQ